MARTIASRIHQKRSSDARKRLSRKHQRCSTHGHYLRSGHVTKPWNWELLRTSAADIEQRASIQRVQELKRTRERNITNQAARKRTRCLEDARDDEKMFFHEIDAPLTAICASCGASTSFELTKKILYTASDVRFKTLALRDGSRGMIQAGVNTEGANEYVTFCPRCYKSLSSEKLPRYAVGSGFVIDPVPDCLLVLNPLEARMIGLGVCFTTVFSLGYLGQSATRGNSINLWNESYDIIKKLPRPANRCGVIVVNVPGTNKPASYHHVRPWLLREALYWLKRHNSLYHDVEVDEELLRDMPEEPVLPDVELDDSDSIISGHPISNEGIEHDTPVVEDSFVMKSLAEGQLEDEKILELLTGSQVEQAYPVPPAGEPMNEFTTRHLMQACFPTLFPCGRGGFHPISGEERKDTYQLADYCAHLMAWHDRRFVIHPTFKFYCLNLIQRRQVDGLMKRLTLTNVSPPRTTRIAAQAEMNMVEDQYNKHKTREYLKELKPFFRSVRGTGLY